MAAKKAFKGGELVIVQQLEYTQKNALNCGGNQTFRPNDNGPGKDKIMVGRGNCGDGRYFLRNKDEAEELIGFIKKCYGIK